MDLGSKKGVLIVIAVWGIGLVSGKMVSSWTNSETPEQFKQKEKIPLSESLLNSIRKESRKCKLEDIEDSSSREARDFISSELVEFLEVSGIEVPDRVRRVIPKTLLKGLKSYLKENRGEREKQELRNLLVRDAFDNLNKVLGKGNYILEHLPHLNSVKFVEVNSFENIDALYESGHELSWFGDNLRSRDYKLSGKVYYIFGEHAGKQKDIEIFSSVVAAGKGVRLGSMEALLLNDGEVEKRIGLKDAQSRLRKVNIEGKSLTIIKLDESIYIQYFGNRLKDGMIYEDGLPVAYFSL